MNWEKFFGKNLYEKLKKYCEDRNMSMASAIRAAVCEFVNK